MCGRTETRWLESGARNPSGSYGLPSFESRSSKSAKKPCPCVGTQPEPEALLAIRARSTNSRLSPTAQYLSLRHRRRRVFGKGLGGMDSAAVTRNCDELHECVDQGPGEMPE